MPLFPDILKPAGGTVLCRRESHSSPPDFDFPIVLGRFFDNPILNSLSDNDIKKDHTFIFKSIIHYQTITSMANTYSKMYIHTVFAVKYRNGMIHPDWEGKLHSVIGNLVNESGGKSILVNGTEDHVHCFFHGKPSVTISGIMKTAKAKSSKWINEQGFLRSRFEWQRGFGCFSYGHSQLDDVYQYILNQKEHHKTMSFREEYMKLLEAFDIDFDEAYIFKKPV